MLQQLLAESESYTQVVNLLLTDDWPHEHSNSVACKSQIAVWEMVFCIFTLSQGRLSWATATAGPIIFVHSGRAAGKVTKDQRIGSGNEWIIDRSRDQANI
jgi:hypothetical protein